MADDTERPHEKRQPGDRRRNPFPLEVLKFVLYVGTLVVGIVAFVLTSQAAQDQRITSNANTADRNTTRYEDHARHATQTFEKIDRTLIAQQELLTRTRETLVRMEVSQDQLVDEVKNLSEQMRKGMQ